MTSAPVGQTQNPAGQTQTQKTPSPAAAGSLKDVVAAPTAICTIDGVAGRLIYRGYSIEDLAAHATFEEVVYLLWEGVTSGKISINRFVEITSTAPAKIFGMYPKKGEIAAGSDADLVIWDASALYTISAQTHHMRVDYSMFEGFEVKGVG